MSSNWKKVLSIFLLLIMSFTVPVNAFSFDGTQSDWAESEVQEAEENNLTYPGVMNNFQNFITREEFCTLAVKLYEGLTGESAIVEDDPFIDTDNPEILKAYHLGIVNGISANSFAPNNRITRQEICVMLHRALKISKPNLNAISNESFTFTDQNLIASWALDAMKFASANQIMKGIGNNQIAPLDNTTREQAIVLLKRTFIEFNGSDGNEIIEDTNEATIPIFKFIPTETDENAKFKLMVENDFDFKPLTQGLTLYAATDSLKPDKKPSSMQLLQFLPGFKLISLGKESIYTDASFSAFIDKNESTKRWFTYTLNNISGVKEVIWQVSTSPFNTTIENWKSPIGLVGTGQIDAVTDEFEVDFNNLNINSRLSLIKPLFISSSFEPIEQKKKTYYVRAVPVDSSGQPIGELSEGLGVIYGERVIDSNPLESIQSSFEIWTPNSSAGSYTGENQDRPYYRPVIRINPYDNENRFFHFNGIESNNDQIGIQVSTKPFPSTGGGWPDTPNIIYEKTYSMPVASIVTEYPSSVFVDFSSFGKAGNEMVEGEFIKYYLRGFTLKDSIEPGNYEIHYSEAITIEYGISTPVTWYSDTPYKKQEVLDVSKPNIKIKRYTPAHWPTSDYLQHYYVFRAPKADDINSRWKNDSTGYILYPYFLHEVYYATKGIYSKSDYETIEIPKVLQVGTTVYFPIPEEKHREWYEQLYDGIVDFFTDLWNVTKDITNQVSSAYNNLKTGLINYVVDLCPIESLKGEFKTALEGMVNAGLMTLGIPPTLPNFDQLTDMSIDYLTEVALTEAGIPPNDITDKMVNDISNGIRSELEKSTNYADSNPIDSNFLKLDPEFNYRPAYVDVEISNPTGVSSISGSFDLNTTFEMTYYNKLDPQYGLFLSSPSNYSYSSDAGITNSIEYRDHFEYGLNGNTVNYAYQGETAVYDVFDPKIGIKVPELPAGESRTVRIYLNPYESSTFTRYPTGENVLSIDFENIYFNNGNKKFTYFTLAGRFPSAEDYLREKSSMVYIDPDKHYVFDSENSTGTYVRLQKSINMPWTK